MPIACPLGIGVQKVIFSSKYILLYCHKIMKLVEFVQKFYVFKTINFLGPFKGKENVRFLYFAHD